MDLVSLCPLPAAHLVWQPAPSRHALTVVCKATYALSPGASALAVEQEPIREHEHHWDDDPLASVYTPSDLVPFKLRAEVVLVGSAHAPNGQPVRALVVRMTVGAIDKSVEVVCPRLRTREGELREGKRWAKMPLLWERAAGGPDTPNPVGVRRDGPRDLYGQRSLPNLKAPGIADDAIDPIGLGPIAADWIDRRRRAGGAAPADLVRAPFGEGFDATYFQAAPADQQVDSLRPTERITLVNLLARNARLVTDLPDLLPRALVEIAGRSPREITLAPDTLWIDTDRAICTLTFRGQIDVDAAAREGRILVAADQAGKKIAWPPIAPPTPRSRPPVSAVVVPPPPAAEIDVDVDVDGDDSLEITRVGSDAVLASDTQKLRIEDPPASPKAPSSPVPTTPQRWQAPPATVTFGPAPVPLPVPLAVPLPESAKVSTQTLDMNDFRSALPTWLQATPPRAPAIVPPPAIVALPPAPRVAPAPVVAAPSRLGSAPPAPLWAPSPGPDIAPLHVPVVAPLGVMDASNAAARVSGAATRPEPEASAASAAGPGPAVELIWFDPAIVPALRRHPTFALYKRSAPPKAGPELETELLRAEIYDALTLGPPAIGSELAAAIEAAEDEGPPATALVLAGGDLELCLDEVATLEAVVVAASSLGASDKKLKDALDLAAEMLKTPLRGMPEVAETLSARIREAWTKANRSLPAGYVGAGVERVLLEQRRYQQRELLDGAWIRALLSGGGLDGPVPAYLPATIAKRLPLFKRISARMLAEVVWQQDQHESCAIALRVVALGRLSASTRGRRAR
ncbi:MAG: DUF2169 domain-containing protein [Byssovorax sp.]